MKTEDTKHLVTDAEAARILGILRKVEYHEESTGDRVDRDSPYVTVRALLDTREALVEALGLLVRSSRFVEQQNIDDARALLATLSEGGHE